MEKAYFKWKSVNKYRDICVELITGKKFFEIFETLAYGWGFESYVYDDEKFSKYYTMYISRTENLPAEPTKKMIVNMCEGILTLGGYHALPNQLKNLI